MKPLIIKAIGLFIVANIFFSCKKTDINQTTSHPGSGTGSVEGIVTDLNNAPVSNATVAGGTATTTTDASGKFTLSKVQFSADSVVLIVTKDGFFEGSKNFASNNNDVSNAKIQLITKPASGTFAASSGGNITASGGGSVNFSAGFVNASNGNAYSGTVSVSSVYFNPADPNFAASVPGNLKIASAANPKGILQSFGAVVVEMNDASGNKLQLASGKTATIALPIPSALQNMAPSSIPLWYFDDTKSSWTREGSATKQGSNYIGTVKHFTFWSAGDLAGSINLTVTIIDSLKNTPFANRLVTLTRFDSTSTSDHTDNTGTATGLIPVNEILIMRVVDSCGTIVYSQNIGPFATDTVLNKINIIDSNCRPASVDTTQFITLTLNGITYSWLPVSDSLLGIRKADTSGSFYTIIQGNGDPMVSGIKSISFNIYTGDSTSPGNYPIYLVSALDGTLYTSSFINQYNLTTTVTEYGAVNEYITGTVSGNMALWAGSGSSTPTIVGPFSCSYKIKRVQ